MTESNQDAPGPRQASDLPEATSETPEACSTAVPRAGNGIDKRRAALAAWMESRWNRGLPLHFHPRQLGVMP